LEVAALVRRATTAVSTWRVAWRALETTRAPVKVLEDSMVGVEVKRHGGVLT